MPHSEDIRQAVSDAVAHAFAAARETVTRQILDTMPAAPAASEATELLGAWRKLDAANTQSEILLTLLQAAEPFAERAALLVLRGGSAILWQARGMGEAVRGLALDANSGVAARALGNRAALLAACSDLDARLGASADAQCVLVPLSVRDRAVALFYADGNTLAPDALEILVRIAGTRIEATVARSSQPSAQTQPAQPDTAAPHAAVAQAETPVAAEASVPEASPGATSAAVSASLGSTASAPAAPASPEDEIHAKARRFAKLLVDELRLYNITRLAAARQAHNVYDVLKDDIEKSREAFNRRFGTTAAASATYFDDELIQVLGEGNPEVFGPNFPR